MTAKTFTNLHQFPYKLYDRNMDMDNNMVNDMDYNVFQSVCGNMSSFHQRVEQPQQHRRANLSLDLHLGDSLQTPEVRPDAERHSFFANIGSSTPGNGDFPTPSLTNPLPTPTILTLLSESHQHPLANDNNIPETVQEIQQEHGLNQQHQQQQLQEHLHQQQQQQPHLHELTSNDQVVEAYYSSINSSMDPAGSPGSLSQSSSHYSHGDESADYSPRPASGGGMSSGNYTDQRRKTGRPTKKQQYDQMCSKKKEIEMENQKLKKKADDYALACKRLREKLVNLIQSNNRCANPVM